MGIKSVDAEDDQFAYRYDTQLLIDRRDKKGRSFIIAHSMLSATDPFCFYNKYFK